MAARQIVFIHGGTAFTQYEDFLQYLRTKPIDDPLGERKERRWHQSLSEALGPSYEVYAPSMPNNRNAHFNEWKLWFERYFEFLHDGVILMGHSLGGYFLAKYLCENRLPVRASALLLIAAPFENDDFGGEDGGDFNFNPEHLDTLAAQVGEVFLLHSTDDPVVPYAHVEKYREALPTATLLSFSDKNHFILEEFPELIAQIRSIT